AIDTDVLVAGYDKAARELVIKLSEDIGIKAWDAGVIQNTMVVEGLTSILIGLNIQYKVPSSGIRITGINE
ncbi:MAG TPA: NADPH-dependent F420 reductase, partial [Anaerolineaceae bacterium]|nr:NADPH-dependent F420 reductase [Anaerolineaceae bacterium]